ncbi:glycylpeptide N-tetradecanoyltransferase 1-like [Hylaeus volcanicus]|uniref:glycylpeptide N-tetradecanoyltransferase 1-like n=1 Tax=Hylaeus volcanicus TaxID=313075 RepID=UPI0023B819FC|nr:glycylpeptide N-tetradecanoyltransferase 1-like [Hylaeus volcanicus]XP_053993547.1 glycylpeptide N-tetradecanoyltransferase 1-like [Hylaeus volcanicus]
MCVKNAKVVDGEVSDTLTVESENVSPVVKETKNPITEVSLKSISQLRGVWRGISQKDGDSNVSKHQFWNTQPVVQIGDKTIETSTGSIEKLGDKETIPENPYTLPSPFMWKTCNVMDDKELEEVYILLNENYVEDDDNMFRFQYSKEFLRWALTVPGYHPEWHVGVTTNNRKLVAFITGTPATIFVKKEALKMAEINFLCVHKKLRSKRLAPVLIKEVTRRVHRTGIAHAVYTAGILLTQPVSECIYYHRSLNIKKLVDIRFTSLGPRTTLSMAQRLYRLPEQINISGLRPMKSKDVPQAFNLLCQNLKEKTSLYPIFTLEEFKHIILPSKDVIVSYVRELDNKITDFFSFYFLPSSVIGNPKYKLLNAAYSYYNVATSVPLEDLIGAALIIAKRLGVDVFNALDLNENSQFIEKLRFGRGDGSLRYYLYNYICPPMEASNVGLVML